MKEVMMLDDDTSIPLHQPAAVQYPDFVRAMIEEICAATETSPEIARMPFGGSCSGSMAVTPCGEN